MRIAPIQPRPASPTDRPLRRGSAVVPVTPAPRTERIWHAPLRRPDPALVAQLLAIRDGDPQTREKRRATPAEAIAAYQRAAGLGPSIPPRRKQSI